MILVCVWVLLLLRWPMEVPARELRMFWGDELSGDTERSPC